MAITAAFSATDTAVSPTVWDVTPETLPEINWDADYVVTLDEPGERILTHANTELDGPETFRFAQRRVSNIYNGTDIPSDLQAGREGTSTLVELRSSVILEDSVDGTYRRVLPFRCGISFVVPTNVNVDESTVRALVYRAISGLHSGGQQDDTGLNLLMRGIFAKASA